MGLIHKIDSLSFSLSLLVVYVSFSFPAMVLISYMHRGLGGWERFPSCFGDSFQTFIQEAIRQYPLPFCIIPDK